MEWDIPSLGKVCLSYPEGAEGERIHTQDGTEGRSASKNIFSKFFKEFLP